MGRSRSRGAAVTQERVLTPEREHCASCGQRLWIAYHEHRRVVRLDGVWGLTLRVRRCRNQACLAYHRPYVPEEAGAWALPQGEFGLDIIAVIGQLRSREQRSVPQIHQALRERGVDIAERSVTVLLHRYEELVALRLSDPVRLRERLAGQGGIILALDGLQPDVGHEVLWVLRDVVSGEVLLARSLLGATKDDLAPLLEEVRTALSGEPSPRTRSPSAASSRTGNTPFATPWHRCCPASRTSSASSTICVKRPDRSSRPTGTPRRNSRNGCVACARLSERSRDRATRRHKPLEGIAWPCAARSPTTGARHWRPLVSSYETAWKRLLPPLSVWSVEALRDRPREPAGRGADEAARPAAAARPARLRRDGPAVATDPDRLCPRPPRGASARQP